MRVYIYVSGEYFTHLGFISGFFPPVFTSNWMASDEITDKVMRNNIIYLSFINKGRFLIPIRDT